MKKLLLVLLMITLASFLFAGCLPVTPSEGEGEGEGEGEVEVAISIEDEYTDAGGVTYVACGSDVVVTFPAPVEIDYLAYVAVKIWDEGAEEYKYYRMRSGTPDATRTVWTFEEYIGIFCEAKGEPNGFCVEECEPICLVAMVKHPCCPGEEVALRIVSLDCTPPYADLYVTFYDCGDPCEDPDPCDLPVPGAYMEWTSRASDDCETTDCCGDDCSGLASWSMEVQPDECAGPCDLVSGTTCPVEGVLDCGCLPYPESGTSEVVIIRTMTDNVGNEVTEELSVILDTDEVISVNGTPVDMGVAVPIIDDACEINGLIGQIDIF